MESIWRSDCILPDFPDLQGDIRTDVLIIGGGIAGILCAYMLSQEGIDYILVEAERICSGVTGNTTAKVTSQHGLIWDKLLGRFGSDAAGEYYRANQRGLERFRTLCNGSNFGFRTEDSFLYTCSDPETLDREMTALEQIGAKAQWRDSLPLPFPVTGAVCFPNQGQVHPLKFLGSLVGQLNILEHTRITSFDGKRYYTGKGSILAEKTIVATHFPIWNKMGLFPLKMYQNRSYVLALENGKDHGGMYLGVDEAGLSFRMAGELLFLGGSAARTGCKTGGWDALEKEAKKYYPHAVIRGKWAAQDCITLDGIPYVGLYSRKTPDLYVMTGFNKWGMTGSMVAAELIRDLVMGRDNPLSGLLDPSRNMLSTQLGVNALHTTWNLLRPTVPRCPHLGCALKWNRQERSWDCSCHGSRFAEDGKLLDNPANIDLKGNRFTGR